nr:MAG TPA: hypothetical protein [Bacteriophage sp.]
MYQEHKAKANANLLLDDVKVLKGEPRAFVEGLLTGLQMNKAPAPEAKKQRNREIGGDIE